MLVSIEATVLLQKNIIKLSTQCGPWILVFPYQHSGIGCPHFCTKTLLKSTVLLIVHQLRLFAEICNSIGLSILIDKIIIRNVLVILKRKLRKPDREWKRKLQLQTCKKR